MGLQIFRVDVTRADSGFLLPNRHGVLWVGPEPVAFDGDDEIVFIGCKPRSHIKRESFISKQAGKFSSGAVIKCSEGLMLEIKQAAINNSFEI